MADGAQTGAMKAVGLTCPYCNGTVPSDSTICPDCQEDLAALARLEHAHAICYNQALALAREGELARAEAYLWLALEARPAFPEAHRLLAKVQARQGRWQDAAASVRRALELAPRDMGTRRAAETIVRHLRASEPAPAPVGEASADAGAGEPRRYHSLFKAFGLGMGLSALMGLLLGQDRDDED